MQIMKIKNVFHKSGNNFEAFFTEFMSNMLPFYSL